MIAFKIFKAECDVPQHVEAVREFYQEERVRSVLAEIPLPYGLLLGHKYHMGASQLTGLDAIILAAARKCSGVQVHLFPVIISTCSYTGTYIEDDEEEYETTVHPFTPAHVDYILKRGKEPSPTTMPWLRGLERVPFYSMLKFGDSAEQWNTHVEETEWTGNESDATRETSLYLSFALVCLSDGPSGSGPWEINKPELPAEEFCSLSGFESDDSLAWCRRGRTPRLRGISV